MLDGTTDVFAEPKGADRNDNSVFGQEAANMINQSRALRYEPVARSMEHLQILLLDRFHRHKSHCRAKMNKKSGTSKDAADKLVKGIRRKTRKQYSAEEKIRIVLAGLRGEESIAALCRREGISESLYYTWSKEFLEAGKQRLAGDTARQATSPEVKELRSESTALKEVVADLTLENRLLKKSMIGDGEYEA
jgi:transposase